MVKLLLLVSFAVVVALEAAPQQEKSFSWLLDSEQWGSKNENSIQPSGIFNSCGGSLNLSSSLQIIQVRSFGNNTRCVWSIKMSQFQQLDVHIDSLNFAVGQSGLAVFRFDRNRTYAMNRRKIPSGNQKSYSYTAYDIAFLTFTSSPTGSGSGFRLGIVGQKWGPSYYTTGAHQFRNAASGTFQSHTSYYSNMERSTVVIQPYYGRYLVVKVTALDTYNSGDTLRIYTPPAYHTGSDGNVDYLSFYGYYPFGHPGSSTNSTELRFCVFSSDDVNTKTGYSLQWYP